MAQTEEFMFQNVTFIPTVYRIGASPINTTPVTKLVSKRLTLICNHLSLHNAKEKGKTG